VLTCISKSKVNYLPNKRKKSFENFQKGGKMFKKAEFSAKGGHSGHPEFTQ
jgi:hypothetical protein